MNKPIAVVLTLILALGCSRKPEKVFEFDPDGTTTIRFEVMNCKTPKAYSLFYAQTLPAGRTMKNISFESDTVLLVDLDLHYPLYIKFMDKGKVTDFFVIPDDTLTLSLDYSKGKALKDVVGYEGRTGRISDYLTRVRGHFYGAPRREQSPGSFNQMIDSIFGKELHVLDSLSDEGTLPGWFVRIEEENIACERDQCKFQQYDQRVWMYNQFIPKGDELKRSIDIGRLENYWLENYFSLLGSFREDKYDTLLQREYATRKVMMDYMQDNLNEVRGKISEEAMSYFTASKLSVLFMKKRLMRLSPPEFESFTKSIDSIIDKDAVLISDTVLLHFILQEKSGYYADYYDQNTLNEGDTAPGFYLADNEGKFYRLSDFAGKVVFINFWATYCAPCIASIPEKNRMVAELENDDFVLVNICLDSDMERWRKIIDEKDFKGKHLICKGNWGKVLRAEYGITSIAHYTLIDKNGIIVKNGIGDSAEYYIRKSL